jgi:hypothetical protein
MTLRVQVACTRRNRLTHSTELAAASRSWESAKLDNAKPLARANLSRLRPDAASIPRFISRMCATTLLASRQLSSLEAVVVSLAMSPYTSGPRSPPDGDPAAGTNGLPVLICALRETRKPRRWQAVAARRRTRADRSPLVVRPHHCRRLFASEHLNHTVFVVLRDERARVEPGVDHDRVRAGVTEQRLDDVQRRVASA